MCVVGRDCRTIQIYTSRHFGSTACGEVPSGGECLEFVRSSLFGGLPYGHTHEVVYGYRYRYNSIGAVVLEIEVG